MFIGHKKQIKFLKDLIEAGKVSQAYIFSGPEDIGKFCLAKMFSRALIENNSDILNDFKDETENKNQNIEILAPEIIEKKGVTKTREIDVERVRNAQNNLALFPATGNYRILVVNDAHRLTIASQNALLKNLEEPNSSAIIILVTHEDGKLLKTIKSRCQKINFNLVSLEEIKNGFKDKVANDLLEKITIFSMGKPGEAQKMIENKDKLRERETAIRDLGNLKKLAVFEKFDLAQNYSKNVMESRKRLEFWIWMLRVQIFRNLGDKSNLEKNYQAIDKIKNVLSKIKNPSLNVRLILENLFLNL
ncbi:MAG: polymerase III, delta prime subunit protein [Candidatus Moranbacteria bacterium GW2011_GWE1_35_17]|nr:MAG: polymerase III, delta prime subunit protein [Candidatus Moranbacteria bacterium GW2011_GWE1_35_17]KKP84547.1 MAG: polymerase III, delta prime subunit protein [Candidatus Moranbacteria bacterium GW2011_GWF1_35_5]